VTLQADRDGRALLSYTRNGTRSNVLVWGAINARHPSPGARQVAFELDYAADARLGREGRRFRNGCTSYDGPRLEWLVAACKAPDGTYWAVQSWQRMLPNSGLAASADRAVWELHLSHWTGEIATLTIQQGWAPRRLHRLFGSFTYRGRPVHGFRATRRGAPLDGFGRNVFVDTLDSAYGHGWRRENSFLTTRGTGTFCYGFYRRRDGLTGMGRRYRATVIGPGVTPDIVWEAPSPGGYGNAAQTQGAHGRVGAARDASCSRPRA
jgi:hypothetical protein